MNTATARIELSIAGRPLHLSLEVPAGPTRRRALLPIFRGIADSVVDISVQAVEARGERVSCRKGCGACCRQLVPITEPEAHALRDLVDHMPPQRRAVVEARFADARERLERAGLLDLLLDPAHGDAATRRNLGLAYFALGIACPFLEDEACSIHADRPIACREYLVTSPAAHCAAPSADGVRTVPLAGRVSNAVGRTVAPADGPAPWVPLILAPEWARAREEEAPRTGRELIEEFFRQLTR